MGKKIVTIITLLAFLFAASLAVAEYDRAAVVQAMRDNAANMGALKEAMENQDFFASAEALMAVAVTTKSLLDQNPPKGSKAEWDRIHSGIIEAAFRGIGTCADEDVGGLIVHVGRIGALIGEGHSTFRK